VLLAKGLATSPEAAEDASKDRQRTKQHQRYCPKQLGIA